MRKGKQFDHDAAGAPVALFGQQSLEGQRVGSARKQLIVIDEIEQRHRLAPESMDDVAIVDHIIALAGFTGSFLFIPSVIILASS
jgi:hypothetical protein